VDVYVVSYQKGSWGIQAIDYENEQWSPCVITPVKKTFEFLCDVEVVMGFRCIMPMLEIVHELIKFVRSCVSFVCNFVGGAGGF